MEQYKALVTALMEKGIRHDGRALFDYRPIEVEVNPIPRANGSARVKIGETDVIVGVKFDVDAPFPDTPEEGILIVNAELFPMASPEFEPGPPGPEAVELARVVDRGIRESGCIDFSKLCIKPKEKVWVVFVDIYPVNDGGNLFDASSLAAIIALKNAVMPKYDEKEGVVLYKELTKKKLELTKIPILTTFIKISNFLAVDPDRQEEKVFDARLSISTLPDGKVAAMQKGGFGTFTKEEVLNLLEKAKEKGAQLRKFVA
ncbi:MAG: exosome complex protein Rrp42 [Candidatus Nanoarchaeia archaeon]